MTQMMPMVTQLMPGLSTAARDSAHNPTAGNEAAYSLDTAIRNEVDNEIGDYHVQLEQELVSEMDDHQVAEEWARIILSDRRQLADMDGVLQEPPPSAAYCAGFTLPGISSFLL